MRYEYDSFYLPWSLWDPDLSSGPLVVMDLSLGPSPQFQASPSGKSELSSLNSAKF